MLHPDASFTLEYQGRWHPYVLEFERRATTPKRVAARLKSYRRYFLSGWAKRDHQGAAAPGALRLRVPQQRERLPPCRRRSEQRAPHHLQRRDPRRAWHPGRHMGASAALFPRQEAAVRPGPGGTMTTFAVPTTSCRGCPSMAAGTICDNLPPRMPLMPSRLPFGAELIRQGRSRPPHLSVALQLWLVATHTSPRTLITNPMMATGACTTTGPQSVPTVSYRGTKGHSLTYGVSPQQVET